MAFKEVESLNTDTTISLGGVNGKTKRPNPTSIQGYFLGSREVPNQRSSTGKSTLYYFRTPNGDVAVWSKKDLEHKMTKAKVGVMTRVTFIGMKPCPGKNDMYTYKLELDITKVIDVGDLETSLDEPSGEEANREFGHDYDDASLDETDLDDDSAADEVTPTRAAAPRQPATAPDAARQARVKELLNRGKNKVA